MRVLALDTATEGCSVAIAVGDELIGRFVEMQRGHAERILDMVDAVLAEAGVALAALDGIAASIGPGSFTGVRIGVAVAQGLAFGAQLSVVPVTTLEALALAVLENGGDRALACLDARMGEVYWGCFAPDAVHGLIACGPPRVSTAAAVKLPEAKRFRGIGRGFSAYPLLATIPGMVVDPGAEQALPNAREIARIGILRLKSGAGRDPGELEPLYLRDNVALTEAERASK